MNFSDVRCRMAARVTSWLLDYLIIGLCFGIFLWMLWTMIDQ